MSVPLDVITRRKLILVKQIYQRAVIQSASQHSDVDRILSLICFDLTNETLLKSAITAVDSRAKFKSEINDLIPVANDVFNNAVPPIPSVPDAQKIRQVRKIRNAAMHDAIYPTAAQISDCHTYTKDFLQQLITNVWDEKFESISLADIIKNPTAKKDLINAETALKRGDYLEAITNAVAGMNWVSAKIKRSKTFRNMSDAVLCSVIGLDFSSYNKYQNLSPSIVRVFRPMEGPFQTRTGHKKPDQEDATFIVEFTTNAIIQIESLVGDIEKPFKI